MARHDLTNTQWAVLEPLLPRGKRPGRPAMHSKRRLIDGIRWRTRAGVPWRDVPPFYGPFKDHEEGHRLVQRYDPSIGLAGVEVVAVEICKDDVPMLDLVTADEQA